jgi:hypothetical protein
MMWTMFHVYIDGASDGTPAGARRLAEAIAHKYGLPAAEIANRIGQGRFRVKGNVDRAIAEQYKRDLERLGARCTIEAAAGGQTSKFQSGLAAAFSGDVPKVGLGALEADGSALSLASLDAAAPVPSQTFEPPAAASSSRKILDEPIEMFAPPESEAAELKIDLAPEERDLLARKRASTPPPSQPAPAPARDVRKSQPIATVPPEPAVVETKRGLGDPRVRFLAGVALAVAIGFVPAHLVAAAREKSAYAEIDDRLKSQQAEADYDTIDTLRAQELDRKHDARRNIALMAMLIWAAVGGGIAYVWFRRIPWDKLQA